MFYVAKILQALGLADVGYSLFVGITQKLFNGRRNRAGAYWSWGLFFGPRA